jgi:hypothetical protein
MCSAATACAPHNNFLWLWVPGPGYAKGFAVARKPGTTTV